MKNLFIFFVLSAIFFKLFSRSLSFDYLPVNDPNLVVLVTNSNVKHELNNSEYAERRRICYESAEILGEKSLRNVSEEKLEGSFQRQGSFLKEMNEILFRKREKIGSTGLQKGQTRCH